MNARALTIAGLFLTSLTLSAQDKPAAGAPGSDLKDGKARTSYGMGVNIGNSWKRQGVDLEDIDYDVLMRGLKDSISGKPWALTETEMRTAVMEFQNTLKQKQQEKARVAGEKNKKEGEGFLAENKKKAGVVTLPSGLQYKVLKAGTGPKPTTNDTVVTHYKGTLIDGTEFDSSEKRGQPATFPVTGVIKGWTEILQLMPVGSKWQVTIPSDLAYGERGAGAQIGPNAVLIFDLDLLSIKPPVAPEPVTSDIIKVPSAEELKKGAKIEVIKPEDAKKQ